MFKLDSRLLPVYETTHVQPRNVPRICIENRLLPEQRANPQGRACIDWNHTASKIWRNISATVEGDKLITVSACFMEPKGYRTKTQVGNTAKMPKALALITQRDYQYALSFKNDEQAHLQLTAEPDKLLISRTGAMYYDNRPVTLSRLEPFFSTKGICDIDTPQLLALYSIVWKSLEARAYDLALNGSQEEILSHCVKMYLPDFLTLISEKRPSLSQDNINKALEKIDQFSKIMGVIEENGSKSIFPLMSWLGYSEKENVIYLTMPYINMVILKVLKASIQCDKQGKPKINKAQQPILGAYHSYLIKPGLAGVRNQRAAELVCAIVALIERAGHLGPTKPPHIYASTLVERCPGLAQAIEKAKTTSDKNKVLKRAFEGAWKLLPKYTAVKDYYQGIKIPTVIPTMGTLDTMLLEFPHSGKNKSREAAKC